MRLLSGLILFVVLTLGHGADTPMMFERDDQEALYKELINELRCLVCQNQSLADSNAPLAQDLRNEVYKMVTEGNVKTDIVDFLVARYGDFVLYRPPLKGATLLLWFGPFLLLLITLVFAINLIRKRQEVEPAELDREQQEKLKDLLNNEDGSRE